MNIGDKIYHLQTLSNSDLIKNMKLISEVQKELINIIDIYYIEGLGGNLKDKKDVDDILQVLAYESNLLEIFKHVKIHLDYIKSGSTIVPFISNFNFILNLLKYGKEIESDYNKFGKSVNNIYSTDYISGVINGLNNNQESIRLIDGYIRNIKKGLSNIEAHHQYLQEQKLNIDNLLLENAQNKDLEILSWLIKKKDELKTYFLITSYLTFPFLMISSIIFSLLFGVEEPDFISRKTISLRLPEDSPSKMI